MHISGGVLVNNHRILRSSKHEIAIFAHEFDNYQLLFSLLYDIMLQMSRFVKMSKVTLYIA